MLAEIAPYFYSFLLGMIVGAATLIGIAVAIYQLESNDDS